MQVDAEILLESNANRHDIGIQIATNGIAPDDDSGVPSLPVCKNFMLHPLINVGAGELANVTSGFGIYVFSLCFLSLLHSSSKSIQFQSLQCLTDLRFNTGPFEDIDSDCCGDVEANVLTKVRIENVTVLCNEAAPFVPLVVRLVPSLFSKNSHSVSFGTISLLHFASRFSIFTSKTNLRI